MSYEGFRVNPVTGCIRSQEQKSPFEGMSEEQKEFEATKLMNAMNQMLEAGKHFFEISFSRTFFQAL